jgi:hypothetical protein
MAGKAIKRLRYEWALYMKIDLHLENVIKRVFRNTVVPPYPLILYPRFIAARKKIEN